ncbi:hypothetical protein L6R52_02490 [Myxococcota bacterium]|nr:hypothetical protein [Myxococcota bacterium]
MRSGFVGIAVLASMACAPARDTATAVLALGAVPEDVEVIAFHVVDPERALVVASATITPPATEVVLGVPAEIPLEFRAVARTGAPAPASLGGEMPAYYGAVARTIPLADEQTLVSFTLHPAGVLTLRAFLPIGSGYDEPLTLRLTSASGEEVPRTITLAPLDPDAPRDTATVVLRRGRWNASVSELDPEDAGPVLRDGRGLWIAREAESIAPLFVVPEPRAVAPTAPTRLELALLASDATPVVRDGVVEAPVDGELPLVLAARGLDANGDETESFMPRSFAIETAAQPGALLVAPPRLVGTAQPVPGSIATLTVTGTGRLRLRVAAELYDGRTIDGVLAVNVLAPGDAPSGPERVELAVDGPEALRVGARLAIQLLDARGLYASARGVIDLSATDPWAALPGGARVELATDARGIVSLPIVRASGPASGDVVVRATFTSSDDGRVIEASTTLPSLELQR